MVVNTNHAGGGVSGGCGGNGGRIVVQSSPSDTNTYTTITTKTHPPALDSRSEGSRDIEFLCCNNEVFLIHSFLFTAATGFGAALLVWEVS